MKAATWKGCTAGKFVDALAGAPGGEAPGGVHIGPAGMIVVDLAGEEFQDALCGFRRGREERRRLEIRRRREDDFGGHAVDISISSGPLPGSSSV